MATSHTPQPQTTPENTHTELLSLLPGHCPQPEQSLVLASVKHSISPGSAHRDLPPVVPQLLSCPLLGTLCSLLLSLMYAQLAGPSLLPCPALVCTWPPHHSSMALDLACQTPKLMLAFWKKFPSVTRFSYQQSKFKNIHSNTLKQCDKECDNIGSTWHTLLPDKDYPFLLLPAPKKGFNTFLEHADLSE